MKAIEHARYGSPDVMTYVDTEKPVPDENEILIKVHAASVNPLDWHKLRASPFFVRFSEGLRQPNNAALGADVSGQVEATGRNVTAFQVGDTVFGDVTTGAFAQYVCCKPEVVTLKPDSVHHEDAAAAPVAALTALQGLRDHGDIQAGQHVLINGASGGVGTYAVQLAKHFGATVTAVCSTRNLELVKRLGADNVIDYTQTDFTKTQTQYDLIFDAVGNCSAAAYQRTLKPGGKAVVAGFTTLSTMLTQVMLLGAIITKTSQKSIKPMLANVQQDDLTLIATLLEQNAITSIIDKRYTLADTANAIRYLETGRARGKVIIQVTNPEQTS